MKININLFSAVLVCLVIIQTTAFASSHREAPLISSDPLADNTDVYAFRSPRDTNNVVLIANYIPFEHPAGGPNWYTFGSHIRYEVHVKNDATTPGDDITYRFTFQSVNEDPTTFFNIRLGKQNLKTTYTLERSVKGGAFTPIITNGMVAPNNIGPRSIENSTVGLGTSYDALVASAIKTAATGEKVFCGPRDDPFFADLGGIFDVGNFRRANIDALARFNCHSIAIEVPISTLQKSGKTTKQASSILDPEFVIGVWASASRPEITTLDPNGGEGTFSSNWIQVSRLGMPLTNEVIIPIGQKDKWNATSPYNSNDLQFAQYFNNPELALYMDDSQFGGAVPGLRQLRIQTKSLGSFDFRNGKKGLFDLKGTPAVAGTALDDAAFGKILLPDNMSPRAVDLLPIFYTGVPNVKPYQLAVGKNGNPLAEGKPFINNFLPTLGDMLRLNMAVPVTPRNSPRFSSYGLLYAAFLGFTDANYNKSKALQFIPNMDGFPNGRRLEDDVTTIELQAVSGVVLASIGLWYDDYANNGNFATPQLRNVLTFNAGVTKNDTTLRSTFPYVQTPWRGFVGQSYSGQLVSMSDNRMVFMAEKATQGVNLKWHVPGELSNGTYEVEYSVNGTSFKSINNLKALSGDRNSYTWNHATPVEDKVNYYRIKQTDKNGRVAYSQIKSIKFSGDNAITVTPNPARDFIKIYTKKPSITVSLFDEGGRKVASKAITNGFGEMDIRRLNQGAYYVIGESNGTRFESKKIIKQ